MYTKRKSEQMTLQEKSPIYNEMLPANKKSETYFLPLKIIYLEIGF